MSYTSLIDRPSPTREQVAAAVRAFNEDRAAFLDLVGAASPESYEIHLRWDDDHLYPVKPLAAYIVGLRCAATNTDAFRDWARFEELGIEIINTRLAGPPTLRDLVARAGLDPRATRLYRHTFFRRDDALMAGRGDLDSVAMLRLLDCAMFDMPTERPTYSPDVRHVVHFVADDAAGDNVIAAVVDLTGSPVAGSVVAWFNREQSLLQGLRFPYVINRPASVALRDVRFTVTRGTERNPLMRLDNTDRFTLTAAPSVDAETRGASPDLEDGVLHGTGPTPRLVGTAACRPDQAQFRRDMLRVYGCRCAVSGCDDRDLLVACHIVTFADGHDDNAPGNGLLLTHHLHALFDRRRLTLHPLAQGGHEVQIAGGHASPDVAAVQGSRITLPPHFDGRIVQAERRESVAAIIAG